MANRKVVVTSVVVSAALVGALGAGIVLNTPNKAGEELTSNVSANTVINETNVGAESIAEEINASEKPKPSLTKEEADEVIKEYFTDLGSDVKELGLAIAESGKDGSKELLDLTKNGLIEAYDFTSNTKPIKGVYFSDLTEKGKNAVYSVAGLIYAVGDLIIPDKFQNWVSTQNKDFQAWLGDENIMAARNTITDIKTLGLGVWDKIDEFAENKINSWRK